MKCMKCGTEFTGNACPKCGRPAASKPKVQAWQLVVFGASLLVLVGAIVFSIVR